MDIRVFIRAALFSLVAAASLYAQNQPPSAEPQTVLTNGLEPVEIILRGSDPEGKDLRFSIAERPQFGELTEPQPIVPPEETDPRTGDPFQPPVTSARVRYTPFELAPDAFTFRVTDAEGASGIAVVTINPGEEEPPPPPETVVARDLTVEVYVDRETVLTLMADAPEGVSVTFDLISKPEHGQLGELVQGSEEPRRSATIPYTPERKFVGEDAFAFKACSERECDEGLIRINVVEPTPEEPFTLAEDVNVKTFVEEPVAFSLDTITRPRELAETFVLRPGVAGNVADADEDGRGDNASPEFMRAGVHLDDGEGATGTARAHMEWDVRELAEIAEKFEIERADVRLRTHRRDDKGVTTFFHWVAADGDLELSKSDFESEAERIPGAVLPFGDEGTFAFSVDGALDEALGAGFRIFSVQGRVNEKEKERAAGLDLAEPELVVETSRPAPPLQYTVRSLPEGGALFDSLGNQIREVPYRLPDSRLTYRPVPKFTGEAIFQFEASDGIRFDVASVFIKVIFGRCQDDARFCNNGR